MKHLCDLTCRQDDLRLPPRCRVKEDRGHRKQGFGRKFVIYVEEKSYSMDMEVRQKQERRMTTGQSDRDKDGNDPEQDCERDCKVGGKRIHDIQQTFPYVRENRGEAARNKPAGARKKSNNGSELLEQKVKRKKAEWRSQARIRAGDGAGDEYIFDKLEH